MGLFGTGAAGFTVEAEPTALYRDLHATAVAAYEAITKAIAPGVAAADLVEASALIEKNGFTTYDDVVHGYCGGYFAPILGSKSRPAGHPATLTLRENMCLVVQPNVITRDEKAGVQVGESCGSPAADVKACMVFPGPSSERGR